MNDKQLKRLEELRFKKDLSKKEWAEYEELVKLQYKTGANDPKPDEPEKEELPN